MDQIEIEIKFFIKNINPIRNQLIKIGAKGDKKSFEKNYRYENSEKNLIKNQSILRLREDKKNTLTLKSRSIENEDKNFKIHRELEVEVSNFSTMNLIIEALGYHRKQIYEKWRETFIYNDTVFCIDTLPYGSFLEIEGSKENIIKMVKSLDFNWDERITISYLEIFDIIRKKLNLNFSDITFDNFRNIEVEMKKILPSIIK